MNEPPRFSETARILAIEVAVYAGLVLLYLAVVLRALRPWLLEAADRHHVTYAALCLMLMLGQGVVLEVLTSWLLRRFGRGRRQEEK